ncbi:MAG: M20/M25/M40 family metallo-hydrolase, partial [Planctomycetota bacterium]
MLQAQACETTCDVSFFIALLQTFVQDRVEQGIRQGSTVVEAFASALRLWCKAQRDRCEEEPMDPKELLARLVAAPTVVGTPNADLIDMIRSYLADHGVSGSVIEGPDPGRCNLFATIGPVDRPGYILSGHVDVVPAEEPDWLGDPFVLRQDGERLIGRGAVDMKGFVAAVLAAVPQIAAMDLATPLHIALSYDEEAGCRGVPHLIGDLPRLCKPPLGCFVGEPTGMTPVLRHKGKATLEVTAKGISGHSARPDLARNAIHALVAVLDTAVDCANRLIEHGRRHPAFTPPHSTVQVGVVEGGTAVNIVPEAARTLIEARA